MGTYSGRHRSITYRDGHVVVRRKTAPNPGRRQRGRAQFTLHRANCAYLARGVAAMPAPTIPYVGTVACNLCRPELEETTHENQ